MSDFTYQLFINVVGGLLVAAILGGIYGLWKWFKKQRFHFEFRFDANPKDE